MPIQLETNKSDDSRSPSLITAGRTEAGDLNLVFDNVLIKRGISDELKTFHKYSRITKISFYLLMASSAASIIAYEVVWNTIDNPRHFVNMFTAFMGFAVAAGFNVIASAFGICSMKEYFSETELYNHCSAVRWLLATGLVLNIVFPTCGLQPLESDHFTRIPKKSLLDCTSTGSLQSNSLLGNCENAMHLKTSISTMYILLPFEIFMIIIYSMWMVKAQTNFLNVNKGQTLELYPSKSNSRLTGITVRPTTEQTSLLIELK